MSKFAFLTDKIFFTITTININGCCVITITDMDWKSLNIAFSKLAKWIKPIETLVNKSDMMTKCSEIANSPQGQDVA
jgi:hypothetical protein